MTLKDHGRLKHPVNSNSAIDKRREQTLRCLEQPATHKETGIQKNVFVGKRVMLLENLNKNL